MITKGMMEWSWPLELWAPICLAVALFLLYTTNKNARVDSRQLPPGPPGWPVFGNLFDLGAEPHRSLATLSGKYGPVIWLRLGAVNTMVVSSAEAAMDMFKNHDLIFAGRTPNEAIKVNNYEQGSIAFAQYGPHWRMLRRICTSELFTVNRINDTENLRRKCIDNMIRWIRDEAEEKGSVEIARLVTLMNFNVIGNALFSKDLVDPRSKKGAEYFNSIARVMELSGKPNVSDFFPFLRPLDPQRIRKKMKRHRGHALNFCSSFVQERILHLPNDENTKKDFLDVMLEFQGNQKDGEPAKISEKSISIMILELFTGSTDTTTSTIEWAVTELLRDASIMRKVRAELDEVVGKNNKVEEGQIGDLHYLQAVVKETLRLHPAVPLLVPRKVREDTQFMGYFVPKDTQIFVNVWAIGRDPVSWDDPLSFKPERFVSCKTDYKGQHFQLIPFGAGRRICPGIPLAHRMLHLALGTLIHSFEWDLAHGISPENIDMKETMGITLRKAQPLKAILKLRGCA